MPEIQAVSWNSIEWEQVDTRLSRKVLDGERMTVTRYSFAPGGRFPHHVHDQEQITFVLSGSVTFTVEGVDHNLSEGSIVIIPVLTAHSAEAGVEGAELLSVVSPPRTEGRGISMLEEP